MSPSDNPVIIIITVRDVGLKVAVDLKAQKEVRLHGCKQPIRTKIQSLV